MARLTDSRFIPALATGALGITLVWQGSHMPHARGWATSPGLFPIIIGAVLVLLAGLLLLERRRLLREDGAPERNAPEPGDSVPVDDEPPFSLTVFAVPAGLALYILSLDYIPFEVATWVFLVVAMWGFGSRSIGKIAVAATTFTLVIAVLFTRVLETLLPGSMSLVEQMTF